MRIRSRTVFLVTTAVLVAVLVGVIVAAVLVGDNKLLLGDVLNWAQGRAGRTTTFVLDPRVPRVLAGVKRLPALSRRKVGEKPLLLREVDDKLVPASGRGRYGREDQHRCPAERAGEAECGEDPRAR